MARKEDSACTVAVAATAGFALVVHMAVAWRYGFFRDELYFIACGRHPSFGYVDQPPLIPLLAAATQAFGHDLFLLRAVPAVAASLTVVGACLLARLAGGGPYAVTLTGIAVATAPEFVGIDGTLNTTAFEPLAWTAASYFFARAAYGDRRALLWAGVVVGLALEAKYEIEFYAVPVVLALALVPERSLLRTREAFLGAMIAAALALPSVVWQWQHGWPFAELIRAGAQGKNVIVSPLAFVVGQFFVIGVVFAPVCIAGVVASLVSPRLRHLRFIGISFIITFVLMLVLHAKDYYLAGLYGSAFALGAGVVERFLGNVALRVAYPALGAAAASVLAFPSALPLLDPPQLVQYYNALPFLRPQAQERLEQAERLPQNLADQLGWRQLAQDVARVYDALPPADRARAAIIASNYGEAGALDFFGPAYGLPATLSGHNQYYLWGTHGYDGSVIIRVNSDDVSFWRKHCREARIAGYFGRSPYTEPYESDRPIVLCRGFYKPLAEDWPEFKNYE